jgi:hypothetical protein
LAWKKSGTYNDIVRWCSIAFLFSTFSFSFIFFFMFLFLFFIFSCPGSPNWMTYLLTGPMAGGREPLRQEFVIPRLQEEQVAGEGVSTALHCTALHCTALHCTALHCTALHCTALHCTALHCRVTRRK